MALDVQMQFTVKYVADGAVYLVGGKDTGLAEGMKLEIKRHVQGGYAAVAQLEVESVASSSSVCTVKSTTSELHPGDVA